MAELFVAHWEAAPWRHARRAAAWLRPRVLWFAAGLALGALIDGATR